MQLNILHAVCTAQNMGPEIFGDEALRKKTIQLFGKIVGNTDNVIIVNGQETYKNIRDIDIEVELFSGAWDIRRNIMFHNDDNIKILCMIEDELFSEIYNDVKYEKLPTIMTFRIDDPSESYHKLDISVWSSLRVYEITFQYNEQYDDVKNREEALTINHSLLIESQDKNENIISQTYAEIFKELSSANEFLRRIDASLGRLSLYLNNFVRIIKILIFIMIGVFIVSYIIKAL